MLDCIFCQIIAEKISAETVLNTNDIIAFKDIKPKARVHILLVPKIHITSVQTAESRDQAILGKLILAAKKAAVKMGVLETGFKLLINCGKQGGQEVDHLHIHLLAN